MWQTGEHCTAYAGFHSGLQAPAALEEAHTKWARRAVRAKRHADAAYASADGNALEAEEADSQVQSIDGGILYELLAKGHRHGAAEACKPAVRLSSSVLFSFTFMPAFYDACMQAAHANKEAESLIDAGLDSLAEEAQAAAAGWSKRAAKARK